jgi:HPt (histidine-containing phosphotransfer) domain-containing protein
MAGDRDKALAAGMNEQIGKPIRIDDMFATLARWIRPSAPVADPVALDPELLPLRALPGIDVSTWQNSRMGDANLYRLLLRMFLRDQDSFPAPFAAALAAGDLTTTQRLAHNLHSLTATLGAHAVAHAAQALEEACATGEPAPRLQALLDDVASHLLPMLAGLRHSPALHQPVGERCT